MFRSLLLATAVALACIALPASADIIISSPANNIGSIAANGTTNGWVAVGWSMNAGDNFQLTDILVDLQISGVPGSTNGNSAGLWSDSGGNPGAELVGLSGGGITGAPVTLTPVTPFTLVAGTSYWVVLTGNKKIVELIGASTDGPTGADATYLGTEAAGGVTPPNGEGTVSTAIPAYLEVDGTDTSASSTAPEPGSIALLLCGVVCLGVRRMRRA